MITMKEALSWLNYGHVTQVTTGVAVLIDVINDPGTQNTAFYDTVSKATHKSDASPFPLEKPEVLANVGSACYYRDEAILSANFLQEAVNNLKSDNHRRGVTQWMLGIACSAYCDFVKANQAWEDACALFSTLQNTRVQSRKTWYLERLQDMRRDMAETPRQAYSWLNLFEPGMLPPSAHHLNNRLLERLERHDSTRGYDLVAELNRMAMRTNQHIEKAEIWVECGLGVFLLGNAEESARFISQAIELFPEHTHKKFVTRWMLGSVLWYSKASYQRAYETWQYCIDEIDYLIQMANYKDSTNIKQWYIEMTEILDAALRDRLEEKYYKKDTFD